MPKKSSFEAGPMKSWISNSKFKKGVYSCDGKVIIFVWDASRRFVSKFQRQMTIVVLKFLKNFVLFFKKILNSKQFQMLLEYFSVKLLLISTPISTMPPNIISKYKFSPVCSTDVKRSLSTYKAILLTINTI